MNDAKDESRSLPPDQTERAVVLLRHLFHNKFCVLDNIPPERKIDVLPVYFCGWLDKHMSEMEAEVECTAAGVPVMTWVNVREMLDRGTAPEALFSVWYAIVLSDRPDPVHALKLINIIVNFTYEDGTISTTQAVMSREMIEGPGFNDNVVASMLRSNMRAMLEAMMRQGLDKLHDQGARNVFVSVEPEDPLEVLLGGVVKLVIPKIKPALQAPVMLYVKFIEQLIRPKLSPEAAAQVKARQQKAQDERTGKPRGGWDA